MIPLPNNTKNNKAKRKLSGLDDKPSIKFIITKRKGSNQLFGATNAVLAWMDKIALSVQECRDSNSSQSASVVIQHKLLKLKGVSIRLKNHWLPGYIFVVDNSYSLNHTQTF